MVWGRTRISERWEVCEKAMGSSDWGFLQQPQYTSAEDPSSGSEQPVTVAEVNPIVKDFASRWKTAIELMHDDVITSFNIITCDMEILRATPTQLLSYYTRLSDCIKRIVGCSALNKDLFASKLGKMINNFPNSMWSGLNMMVEGILKME